MLITNIKLSHKYCYYIICDDDVSYKIHSKFIDKYDLTINKKIDSKLLDEIVFLSTVIFVRHKIVYYLSNRDYSKRQLYLKLYPDFPADCIRTALGELEDEGVIDDKKFALKKAEFLVRQKNYNTSRIRLKLISDGVSFYIVDEVTEYIRNELSHNDKDALYDIIEKKYINKLNTRRSIKSTYNALIRFGFSHFDIKPCINEFLAKAYEKDDSLPQNMDDIL